MKPILIACEYSGRVRDAFVRNGVPAVSCDLLPSESEGLHIQDDIREVLNNDWWSAVIAFPPCTDLAVSGARWFPEKIERGEQQASIEFFLQFTRLTCPWAIENPVGIVSTVYRTPDQYIQPWQFGFPETKKTCLWFNKLPSLSPTNIVCPQYITRKGKRFSPTHFNSFYEKKEDRGKIRSLTYSGIADAMGDQWAVPIIISTL